MVRQSWPKALTSEARAVPEFMTFALSAAPLLAVMPRGDGHPVLVLPGLGATDASSTPLRWFLGSLGYHAVGWGLGRNDGFGPHVSDGLDDLLLTNGGAGNVSVIGWSLGGVHAVELARRWPGSIRSLITLGSPLRPRHLPPANVPATSVYSRSDAIVPWRTSILPAGPRRESVEVRGSHLGLGHNPAVAMVIADRLAQNPEQWQPFTSPRWGRHWLPAA